MILKDVVFVLVMFVLFVLRLLLVMERFVRCMWFEMLVVLEIVGMVLSNVMAVGVWFVLLLFWMVIVVLVLGLML